MRCGADVNRFQLAIALDGDGVGSTVYFRTRFAQLLDHRVQQLGACVAQRDLAAGHGGCHQVSAGFDAIAHHGMLGAAQALYAMHGDHVATGAFYARAHLDQAFGHVHHFRLACGIFQGGGALCQRGCHHQVFRAGHRDDIHKHAGALQTLVRQVCRAGLYIAVLYMYLGTHGLQPLDMQIHRARAYGTAAGQRHAGVAEARQQRSQHQDGSTHGFHHFVGRFVRSDMAGVQRDLIGRTVRDLNAHML